ncbi:MAG: hypothetical protein AAF682_06325 [Planctomycetota bacterium]
MLLFGSALCLAQIFTVDDNGPADFSDLPEAVAAASAGDTILVQPGVYTSFSLDKGVKILGQSPQAVRVETPGGPVAIGGVPAGEEAIVGGLTVQPNGGPAVPFTVTGNAGSVVLHDLQIGQVLGAIGNPPGGLLILGSDQVLLSHCELFGGGEQQLAGGFQGNVALEADLSNVSLQGCRVVGGTGSGVDASNGQAGIRLVATSLELIRTTVDGGATVVQANRAGDAIIAQAGSEVVAWGIGGEIQGGSVTGASVSSDTDGGYGIILQDSSALVHPDVPVAGGKSGTLPQFDADPVLLAPGGVFESLDARPPTLTAAPLHLEAGDTVDFNLSGEDDAVVAVYWSLALGSPLALDGLFGQLRLDLATAAPLFTEVLSFEGFGFEQIPVAASPSLLGVAVHLQGAQVAPGLVGFSNVAIIPIDL